MASDWRPARGRFVEVVARARNFGLPAECRRRVGPAERPTVLRWAYLGSATGCTQAVGTGRAYDGAPAAGRPGHAPPGGGRLRQPLTPSRPGPSRPGPPGRTESESASLIVTDVTVPLATGRPVRGTRVAGSGSPARGPAADRRGVGRPAGGLGASLATGILGLIGLSDSLRVGPGLGSPPRPADRTSIMLLVPYSDS
jgi:hypothetical protein